jgi:hypothetical protein
LAGCLLLVENAAALGHSLSAQHRQLLPAASRMTSQKSNDTPHACNLCDCREK